jgi:hypothetical protein
MRNNAGTDLVNPASLTDSNTDISFTITYETAA